MSNIKVINLFIILFGLVKSSQPSPEPQGFFQPAHQTGPERKGQDADTRRVFNGTATRVARYPFMASLHVRGRFVCAGSLVRADLLITAASGLVPSITPQSDPRSVEARVGSDYTDKLGELVPVAGLHFHPKFNRTTRRYNLAITQLEKQLKLEHGKIIAIRYDRTADYLPADLKQILILGWGEKKPSSKRSYNHDESDQQLSSTLLDLQDLKKCKHTYSRTYVSNKHFCASSDVNGGGVGQFDVGGPAVAGRMLVGVASFRLPQRDAPTVFTKLGYYADWIKSVFKENPPQNKHTRISKNDQWVIIPDSDEVPADEKQFFHRLVKTGLKSVTEKEPQYEDDIFKKTTRDRRSTRLHPDILLDPKLVPTTPRLPKLIGNYDYKTLTYGYYSKTTTTNTYAKPYPVWLLHSTDSDYPEGSADIKPLSITSTPSTPSSTSTPSIPSTASTPSTPSTASTPRTTSSESTPSTTSSESTTSTASSESETMTPPEPFTRMDGLQNIS